LKIPKGKPETVDQRKTDNKWGQRKKEKSTHNNLQNTTEKTKDRATRIPTKIWWPNPTKNLLIQVFYKG